MSYLWFVLCGGELGGLSFCSGLNFCILGRLDSLFVLALRGLHYSLVSHLEAESVTTEFLMRRADEIHLFSETLVAH